jgi:hypothetical protein
VERRFRPSLHLALKAALRIADQDRMRHFRLWLLLIAIVSLAAEAIAAAAVFWRGSLRARRPGRL